MEITKYILLPVSDVEKELKALGFETTLTNNNHNVSGDTKLVTNIKIKDKTAEIIYGEFILDI